jgi:hypothetical protein
MVTPVRCWLGAGLLENGLPILCTGRCVIWGVLGPGMGCKSLDGNGLKKDLGLPMGEAQVERCVYLGESVKCEV